MIDLLSLFSSSKTAPPVSLVSSTPPSQDFSVQFDELLQSLFAGISETASASSPQNTERVLLPPGEGGPREAQASQGEASCKGRMRVEGPSPGAPRHPLPQGEGPHEKLAAILKNPSISADIQSADAPAKVQGFSDAPQEPPRVSVEEPKPIETDAGEPDIIRPVRRALEPSVKPTNTPSVAIAPALEQEPRLEEVTVGEPRIQKPIKVKQSDGPKEKPVLEDEIVKAWRPPLPSLPFATLQVRDDGPQPIRVSDEPAPASKSFPSFEQTTAAPAPPSAAASFQANIQASARAVPEVDIAAPASHLIAPHPLEVAATMGLAAEIQQAVLDDVKKFEVDTRHEPAIALEAHVPEPAPAVITTDPIANLRQLQLPPRVIAIQKVTLEPKSADRPKTEQATTERGDAGTSVPIPQALESRHDAATIDQSLPAQPIEIPDIPKLKLVRTVSMEVGEAESQVSIRIEERGGDMKLHLGVGNETLHRELESSMGLLIHTLKQEDIQVSTAEVSRKSPIEKVRRMKEANNGHR